MIANSPVAHAYDAGGPLGVVSADTLIGGGALGPGVAFSRASSGRALGADGATLQAVAADMPRFHGTARRLLVEGQRQNLLLWSQDLAQASWAVSNGAAKSATALAAPDGTGSGATIAFGSLSRSQMSQSLGLASGTYTASVWAREAGGRPFRFKAYTPDMGDAYSPDLATTPEWRRYSFTFAVPSAQAGNVAVANRGAGGVGSVEVWGVQLEQGAFASSYVPTTGAAATRAPDLASYPLSSAQAQAGTLVGTFLLPAFAPLSQGLLLLDDGTAANRLILSRSSAASAVRIASVAGGVAGPAADAGPVSAGVPFRAALTWDGSGASAAVAGGAPVSVAAGPAGLSRLLMGYAGANLAEPMFGEVGPLTLYPVRLPDAQLQALTSN
ncbi:hypothetical protein VQH23_01570 [Pararoseomonas sp. SCSIO 73927]|uniref:phage head spike fiber domain-containing protein n=1 Tax=Pararoseomonas sp. SCSIO 73927 TaxID=3114537 RepID=UPI0030CC1856